MFFWIILYIWLPYHPLDNVFGDSVTHCEKQFPDVCFNLVELRASPTILGLEILYIHAKG